MNGQHIQIKELQDIASKTAISFFKLSMEMPKVVIIAEIEKILNEAQEMAAKDNNNLRYKFDWSMEPDVQSPWMLIQLRSLPVPLTSEPA
jgi:hypothetical protein